MVRTRCASWPFNSRSSLPTRDASIRSPGVLTRSLHPLCRSAQGSTEPLHVLDDQRGILPEHERSHSVALKDKGRPPCSHSFPCVCPCAACRALAPSQCLQPSTPVSERFSTETKRTSHHYSGGAVCTRCCTPATPPLEHRRSRTHACLPVCLRNTSVCRKVTARRHRLPCIAGRNPSLSASFPLIIVRQGASRKSTKPKPRLSTDSSTLITDAIPRQQLSVC